MKIEHIRQICTWLAATDITEFELQGPGVRLSLRTERPMPSQISAQPVPAASAAPAVAAVAASQEVVRAGSVGVFRSQHPQQAAPLATVGMAVRASQPVGLLQIGPLLLPVLAPCEAVVQDMPVPDGTVVGWGTPLVVLATH
ncbi:acetyl-CoA carboxylase [Ralstonia solanacearum]|uniref:acetyl-CoA carboxylase n=1 Tax=Ralstonia solanacearum TaxID=305 RepID=UPI0005C69CFD|nr:acetyl-CoA carboxylase [Ralstonia solanacearum]MBB6593085.1 acetyl-CoA carboxylase [Ralstonia solanacearum]MBB6597312.1 acetyl-CoA carboxylase [Ralstonia solanacearum]MDB0539990.1 acetyl-CoA carboxylase [Ralstonia solanacearum]MDB0549875.1 acetyl-CoA carboxylase [Ralstonia solanacearum]MDB0554824.1 acetyl-CoA carboxylase [Ralstonia solanacearum]